jgi:hypothetical protein
MLLIEQTYIYNKMEKEQQKNNKQKIISKK